MEKEQIAETVAEQLRKELDYRGQFYFKGFGMIVVGIRAKLEIWTVAEKRDKDAQWMCNQVARVTEIYQKIPFDQILDHPDHDLLSKIWGAISRLGPEIEEILNGKEDVNEAYALLQTILNKGYEYRLRLRAICDELHKQPGHENDDLRSTCVITGKVWDLAL